MFLTSPEMQRIYELLAFIVALFFPAALLTWLVIDKFFSTGEDRREIARQRLGKLRRDNVLVDRSQQ
jgi:hypothetical protein